MAPVYQSGRASALRLVPNEKLAAALRKDCAGIEKMIISDAPEFDDIRSISLVAARNARSFGCLGV